MNILFIENNFSPTMGGVERVSFTLGEAFRSNGHQVFYAFRGKDDTFLDSSCKLKFDDSCSNLDLEKIFETFIVKHQISIVICQNLHALRYQQIYNVLKRKCNISIVACLHCNPDIWVNKNKWGHTFAKIYIKELIRTLYFKLLGSSYQKAQIGMYEISDKYLLLSDSFKPIFCKLNSVDGKKLFAIPNPCPFTEDVKEEALQKENSILIVARMAEQQKRIYESLMIWKALALKHTDWNLVVVGDGPDLDKYKNVVNKEKINNVKFAGNSSKPQEYYKKAKIFMMTSIWEGLPMTLIEAQHFGCVPVAYNSFASVKDIITDGKDGYVIPLCDRYEFRQRLSMMMSSPDFLHGMSQNCLSKNNFNMDNILLKWNELFNIKFV